MSTSPVEPRPGAPDDAQRFRRTLVSVLAVQLVSLVALWWLQTRFTH
jgi:hypothetical protein